MEETKFHSGSKKHTAVFRYAGEIRFGPPYFDLEIDGLKIFKRLFSDCPVWSADEKYLALQEWNSTRESIGPNMKICIFDLENGREYTGKPIHGYTVPKHFEGNLLIYEKRDWSEGYEIINTIELDLDKIENWEKTKGSRRFAEQL